MKIEILGDGCTKCWALKNKVQRAVDELGVPAEVTSIMDPEQLTHLNALSLPLLVINGTIVSARSLLSTAEIKAELRREEAQNEAPSLRR